MEQETSKKGQEIHLPAKRNCAIMGETMRVFYRVTRGNGGSRREKVEERAKALGELLARLGQDPETKVERDKSGRLYFPDKAPFDLSVTHAEPFTAYAVGEARVGIDMEDPARVRHPKRMAARFFTEAEQAYVMNAPDPCAAFCLIWTKKEALAKYLGKGLANTYHICTFSPPEDVAFYSREIEVEGRVFSLSLCVPAGTEISEG